MASVVQHPSFQCTDVLNVVVAKSYTLNVPTKNKAVSIKTLVCLQFLSLNAWKFLRHAYHLATDTASSHKALLELHHVIVLV